MYERDMYILHAINRRKKKMLLERKFVVFWGIGILENGFHYFPSPKKGPSTADLPSGTHSPKNEPVSRRV